MAYSEAGAASAAFTDLSSAPTSQSNTDPDIMEHLTPVLLLSDEEKLCEVNPITMNNFIQESVGEIDYGRRGDRGGILIYPKTLSQKKKLLQVTQLGPYKVTVTVPKRYVEKRAIIRGVHPEITPDELLEYLQEQHPKITSVCFLSARNDPNKQATATTPWTVLLTFKGTAKIPPSIMVGFEEHFTSPYKPKPMQCFNCFNFGHISKRCQMEKRCQHCAGHHDPKTCPSASNPICGNCGGNHMMTDQKCPKWIERQKVVEIMYSRDVSFREAMCISREEAEAADRNDIHANTWKQIEQIQTDYNKAIEVLTAKIDYLTSLLQNLLQHAQQQQQQQHTRLAQQG